MLRMHWLRVVTAALNADSYHLNELIFKSVIQFKNKQISTRRGFHGPSFTFQPATGQPARPDATVRRPVPEPPASLVSAPVTGSTVVAGQSQPVDERTDIAGTEPGLAERPGAGPGRAVDAPGDQPATPGPGPAGGRRQRRLARCLAGFQPSRRTPGTANLQCTGADPDPGLGAAVHGAVRYRRGAQAGGAGQGDHRASDPAYPGGGARYPATAARGGHGVAPAGAPAGQPTDFSGGPAGLSRRRAPGPGHRLDIVAGGGTAGLQ
ncbi:hypothetical protein D3C76_1003890 [compost metagenome]